ncbi:S-DNA-T family DNA segregation ATPase FtsK/SpoIIIE [Arthrobacter sp. CAN_A6]|uniref:FtsK/SpoIIIE domain-containing protein n=1 Tax=Arthrobacter sp. CAN_A6 TaxID=2787721 RepID=UPI0018CB90E6
MVGTLHLSLVIAALVEQPVRELVVDTALLDSGTKISNSLGKLAGTPLLTVAGLPLETLTPGDFPLVDGAVVVAGATATTGRTPSPSLVFVVHTGPDAGRLTPLARGTHTIGRDHGDIPISDPEMSRHHAPLVVGKERITLSDAHSSNGTWVDGALITESTITTSSLITCGSSTCRIALPGFPAGSATTRAPSIHGPSVDGPATAADPLGVDVDIPLDVEALPPPELSRTQLVTAFLPLVLGVALALSTGMWFFLAFSALSAVTGVVPFLTRHRRSKAFDTAVGEAAERDGERRRRAVADAGELALAAETLKGRRFPPRSPTPPSRIHLRIGLADQRANVAVRGSVPGWEPPLLAQLPCLIGVELDRSEEMELHFQGEPSELLGLARLLLLQVSFGHAGTVSVLCWGSLPDLPSAARFLPGVELVTHPGRLGHLLRNGSRHLVFAFGGRPLPDAIARPAAVLRFQPGPGTAAVAGMATATVALRAGKAIQTGNCGKLLLTPDLVGTQSFDRTARAMGGMGPKSSQRAPGHLPATAALPGQGDGFPAPPTVLARWRETQQSSSLGCPIGVSTGGPLHFDLAQQGPHLLVAGTTGSGKSEFLRTLLLGIAANHSPARVNFLLIDFKGGSGLGKLARLPHAVGFLSDLSTESVTRSLVSLRAELGRREAILADHGMQDISELSLHAGSVSMPHLIVVIDEFRMLTDDVPGSVQKLLRIATLGRSLGLHLVMATQRPQGAITPDIRANVNTAVAFRVQTAMDSQDIIGSPAAAVIPVSVPGRAIIRVGSDTPVPFQTASLRLPTGRPAASGLEDLETHLTGPARGSIPGGERAPTAGTAGDPLAAAVSALAAAAATGGHPSPRRPVMPPLPRRSEAVPAQEGQPGELYLGVLDLPRQQAQRGLFWAPGHHSHLGLVGIPSAGGTGLLAHVLTECLDFLPETHLYVLDGDSTLGFVSARSQTGAHVGGHEVKRAARVLERLALLLSSRLTAGVGADRTPILLAVSGWGRWTSLFRNSRFSWAEDSLHDLVRDGEAAHITIVITGNRELVSSRLFGLLPNRIYFPAGAAADSLLTWPKLPDLEPVQGRGLVQGPVAPGRDAVAQLVVERRRPAESGQSPTVLPFPVAALPVLIDLPASVKGTSHVQGLTVPLGVSGDNLDIFSLQLPAGSAFIALGARGSGRSNLLDVIEQGAGTGPGTTILRAAATDDPSSYWRLLERGSGNPDPRKCVLLVDDADALPTDVQPVLASWVARGAAAVLTVVPGASLPIRVPLALQARAAGRGLHLAPRSPLDGDFFGVRFDLDGRPKPGRAFLVEQGTVVELQIFRRPPYHSPPLGAPGAAPSAAEGD